MMELTIDGLKYMLKSEDQSDIVIRVLTREDYDILTGILKSEYAFGWNDNDRWGYRGIEIPQFIRIFPEKKKMHITVNHQGCEHVFCLVSRTCEYNKLKHLHP